MNGADISERRAEFRKLHESGCFAIPNPWDAGTARYLRHLGFRALATTSSGLAFSLGLPDAAWAVPRDVVLEHIAGIVRAVDLPVSADFESGYAHDPEGVAANVRMCVDAGVAGLSIEDATGEPAAPLYERTRAVERIRAAKAAVEATGTGALLTARSECFLVGHPDPLREAVRRLESFAEAGADVLFAPGIRTREEIQTVVAAVRPKPVNVLMMANTGLRLNDLAELGVRRVSVGSSLARAAWTAFRNAAHAIAEEGSFAGFEGSISFAELNSFFLKDLKSRGESLS